MHGYQDLDPIPTFFSDSKNLNEAFIAFNKQSHGILYLSGFKGCSSIFKVVLIGKLFLINFESFWHFAKHLLLSIGDDFRVKTPLYKTRRKESFVLY